MVRKLKASEWRTYRNLRLRALEESPDAFSSTLAAEQSRTSIEWEERLSAGMSSNFDLPLIAEMCGQPAGIVWAKIDPSDASRINIYQMWVAPEFRGQGVGRALLRYAIEWAKTNKAVAVHLGVTLQDTPAMRLYLDEGFRQVGQTEALRPYSPLLVQPMELSLNEKDISDFS